MPLLSEKRFEKRKPFGLKILRNKARYIIAPHTSYIKKKKKRRQLFNTWMFHTNVMWHIPKAIYMYTMYIKRKRKKKKKKSHLPANLFFSTTYMQDDMNPSAVSFYICPCHIRIEIIDKRMGYNTDILLSRSFYHSLLFIVV